MKFKILKAIDIAGLQIFDPIVRLIYGEAPKEQIHKIGLFIGIPIITFAIFLMVWAYVAPRHTTKAGEVPTPGVVTDAAGGIWTFHVRENQKAQDFLLTGEDREKALAAVDARIAELTPLSEAAEAKVKAAEAETKGKISEQAGPLEDQYKALKTELRTASKEREAKLIAEAETLPVGDATARNAFLEEVAAHEAQDEADKQTLRTFKEQIDAVYAEKTPGLEAARTTYNGIQGELQYLSKRKDYLTADNQALKVKGEQEEMSELEAAFLTASGGKATLKAAERIIKKQDSIERIASSEYSRPWTFPRQIIRSVTCVFLGFAIGTAIAIPLGIICGLSRVLMAALTPLIALFKPVSPIVWLPIVFIIVGGFISDPDTAPVHPAFLSSAITVALCSLWPTLVNTALGVASVEKDHVNVARVLRLGFFSRLFKIILPSSLPLIFAGLRISLGVGWMVLIAAELLSSSEGIGKFVWDMFNNGSSQTFAQMFVVVFVVGIVGLLLDRIMIVFQRLVSFDGAPTAI
ncbi:ABC transporter permease [Rubellicoccus peritrichatus]|uniref:ABC transporter permease subunit n=1 Tax=Rubellicoccus peritrichatus TaxID=3080537 RepID=A0AAQ3QUM7_9BACT|nr:ABC transporter permease subunit [Puniceicoccus sp. CR14]WOO39917.1 ABC transporter permease subunit [Puniceicoccus sp. CR14]